MVLKRIALLSFLVTQALSAPTGCTESCNFYQRHHQVQTSHGYQDHAGLTQAASSLQNLDFSRPGNWTKQNEYGTDDGHGKVHEEQGQYVDNSKKIRYFKKNYTSSYSTNSGNTGGLSAAEQQNNYYTHDIRVPNSQQILDSQRAYNQRSEAELSSQHYNRIQSQQREQSLRRTNTQSERLEDLGEYNGDSQVIQQGASGFNSQHSQGHHSTEEPGSWSRVNSYKTDGGRGQVFEEEGQYVTGPKKVRYYKRNYTSSYKSTGEIPTSDISTVGLHDIQRQIENLHREIGKDFHQASAAGNTASIIENAHVNTIGASRNNYRQQNSHGSAFNNMEQHNTEQHMIDTSAHTNEDLPDTNPIQGTYGTNRHRTYERHEAYMTNGQPVAQYINPTSGHTNVLTGSSEYNRNRNAFNTGTLDQQTVDNLHQVESSSAQHSRNIQHQISNDNVRQSIYNQNIPSHSIPSGHSTHYQEQWHSSSQTRETSVPQYNTDILHIDEQSAQYNRNHHGNQHNSQYNRQGQNNYLNQYRESNYNSNYRGGGSSTSGMLNLGQIGENVDCTQDTLEQVHEPRHHRNYKRDVKYDELSDTQQQSEDLTQQNEDLTQQTQDMGHFRQHRRRKIDFGQQVQGPYNHRRSKHYNQDLEDFRQQETIGKPEFGQETERHYPERPRGHHSQDYTQQYQQNRDMTAKKQESDDFTQQTSGNIEIERPLIPWEPTWDRDISGKSEKSQFDQQTQHSQHSQHSWRPNHDYAQNEDLTQQTGGFDDFTQQTSGKLEFGQQPHSTGSAWNSDLTQTAGKLEFGQHAQYSQNPSKPTSDNAHIEDLTQQGEDLTQQTGDFDDFTQQTSGKLEFGQQSKPTGPTWDSDLTQNTGKLEFGHQTQHSQNPSKPTSTNAHTEDLTQQGEDLTQQTGDFDDFTQQTSGKLEFGQQSKPTGPTWDSDLTQNTGKLEFGHQTQHSHNPSKPTSTNAHTEDLTQQGEDLTQQTGDFDDFTQQTSGKLEFGQQSKPIGPTWGSDLTQNTGKLEFGHQTQHSHNPSKPTSTNAHTEDLTQQGEDLTQQTGDFDDFTQQTSGKLEFGQQSKPTGPTWNSDFSQNTGKLEFGYQTQHSQNPSKPTGTNAHVEDLSQQGAHLTQQTGEFDDFMPQTHGKLEFGQQSVPPGSTWNDNIRQKPGKPGFGQQTEDLQSSWKPTNNNAHMEDFAQQNEDLTQQTGEFDDFTQQTSGNLEFGQQSTSSGFMPQQIGFGQEPENLYKPQRPYTSNQDMGDLTQQTDSKFEFGSQYNQQEDKNGHIEQPGSSNYLPKPAEKPKRRPMYRQPAGHPYSRPEIDKTVQMQNEKQNLYNQETSHLDSGFGTTTDIHAPPAKPDQESDVDNNRRGDQGMRNSGKDNSKDLNQQTNVNIFDIDRENVDQLNRLHKSNDATVGLQWHYTYHPSDLTNSEPVQNSFYPSLNYNSGVQQKEGQLTQQSNQRENEDLQQQSRPYNFDHQQTQNAHRSEDMNQQSSNIESINQQSANMPPSHSQHNFDQESQTYEQSRDYVFGQPMKPIQQADNTRTQGQLEFGHQTKNHQAQNHDNKPLFKPEPRILEAYGGGPYDGTNTDDIYSKVTINPSATLPPTNVDDSWDIREKPIDVIGLNTELTNTSEPIEATETTTEAIVPPSFWGRIGNKITNTFDKVKEKARGVFG